MFGCHSVSLSHLDLFLQLSYYGTCKVCVENRYIFTKTQSIMAPLVSGLNLALRSSAISSYKYWSTPTGRHSNDKFQ